MGGTALAIGRRSRDPRFTREWFVGHGLDVGAGIDGLSKYSDSFPHMKSVREWDLVDGDATDLEGIEPESFDFVYSSHCLEHLNEPLRALVRWAEVLKPGGHLIVVVPEVGLYEQGVWPSTFNPDHKYKFAMQDDPNDELVFGLATTLPLVFWNWRLIKLELLDAGYPYGQPRQDWTLKGHECAIEFVLRKVGR